MLDELHRDNLFLTALDDDGTWYRYHRLFAGVLRSILGRESPELIPELHQLAADWYAEQGDLGVDGASRAPRRRPPACWLRGGPRLAPAHGGRTLRDAPGAARCGRSGPWTLDRAARVRRGDQRWHAGPRPGRHRSATGDRRTSPMGGADARWPGGHLDRGRDGTRSVHRDGPVTEHGGRAGPGRPTARASLRRRGRTRMPRHVPRARRGPERSARGPRAPERTSRTTPSCICTPGR